MTSRGSTRTQRRPYSAKDYDHLLGVTGFSDEMLSTHFKLYQGYVKHTNKALEILEDEKIDAYARKEVQRRFVWEYNGVRLHELYFNGMSGGQETLGRDSGVRQAVEASFGSYEEWLEDFRMVGTTRGIGWTALVHDPIDGQLLNLWVNEHDAGPLARTDILLIMDVWEHAFMRDFGTDRNKYMDTYFDAVAWDVVEERLKRSQRNAPAHLGGTMEGRKGDGDGRTTVRPRRS